jgi:hypothetical protein
VRSRHERSVAIDHDTHRLVTERARLVDGEQSVGDVEVRPADSRAADGDGDLAG